MSSDFKDELDELETKEGGKGLRRKLEATLAENRKLNEKYITLAASELISENGWTLVKPEDLTGIGPDGLEERAKELHMERLEQRKEVYRDLLIQQGVEGDELEKAVEGYTPSGTPAPVREEPSDSLWEDVQDIGRIGGTPPPVTDESKLHGINAIAHALAKQGQK